MNQDTNFDDLAEHFQKRIYGSQKGAIRLAVLQRDLSVFVPKVAKKELKVLDIGAGMAQISMKLAQQGHDVLINDVSQNMLNLAKQEAKNCALEPKVRWSHGEFQKLQVKNTFDLVLCHAVLEWLDNPEGLFPHLTRFVSKNGLISLMFYNLDALVFHNLIRGNFNKINNHDFSGMKGGLTPPNPLKPAWVEQKLTEHGFEVLHRSGIRVFNDYVGVRRGGNEDPQAILDMELRYSEQEPYVNMGRYIHVICKSLV